jgi:uncharacterized protein YjbI with pentapeptide repeats
MSSDVLAEEGDWKSFLQAVERERPVTRLQGITVSAARFAELRARLPRRADKVVLHAPDFTDTVFEGDVSFKGVHITGTASFAGAKFLGAADFESVTAEEVSFEGARFSRDFVLRKSAFEKSLNLSRCQVTGELNADSLRCSKPVLWRDVQSNSLVLDHVVLDVQADIEVTAAKVSMAHAVCTNGITLRLGKGEVTLDGAVLSKASLLLARGEERPVLRSIANVDVSTLTVDGLDLSSLDLRPAHNVDKIRLKNVAFGTPPDGWRTRRRVIAEERGWRGWEGGVSGADPSAAASVYRALRKALEDGKDEPGAADFYFGEMEMRRWDRWLHVRGAGFCSGARALGDYLLLSLYLLLSGYGLRAGRAVPALLLLVAAGAVLLAAGGFPAPKTTFDPVAVGPWGDLVHQKQTPAMPSFGETFPRALRLASQSVLSLLSAPAQQLTPLGDWVVLVLRLMGPVLLGLLVLAVRNKLKR